MEKKWNSETIFLKTSYDADVHTCGLVLFHNMKSAVFVL